MQFSETEWNKVIAALERWLKDYPVPTAKLEAEIDGTVMHYTPKQLVEGVRKQTEWGMKIVEHMKQSAFEAGFASIPEFLEAMTKEWESFSEEDRQEWIEKLKNTQK